MGDKVRGRLRGVEGKKCLVDPRMDTLGDTKYVVVVPTRVRRAMKARTSNPAALPSLNHNY